jgi:hypothetical protein
VIGRLSRRVPTSEVDCVWASMMCEVTKRLEADLAAITQAIDAGQLEDAKRILVGIPQHVSLGSKFSQQIGDLYLELGFPAMAGRYWYLLEDKSDRMITACEEFERSLGYNPCLISEAMGWCPDLSPYANARLTELRQKAESYRRQYGYAGKPRGGWRDRACLLGCALMSFVFVFVFVMGIIFIVQTL